MRNLFEHVQASLVRRRLAPPGAPLAVAVSGGLDSMALLRILREIWRGKLLALHFNHQLRGMESDADEDFVSSYCRDLDIPCRCGQGNVRERARQAGESIEMAARELRHVFLAETAAQNGIKVVVLAHHQDDQLELFLLRLLRGSGPRGLAGMEWLAASPAQPNILLARPLLDVTKDELRVFARERDLSWREDSSNATREHQRNRIRQELLPSLEREYQPSIRRKLAATMDLIAAESALVGELADAWLNSLETGSNPDPAFSYLPLALQRRVVHRQLWRLRVHPTFELVEDLRLNPGVEVDVQRLGERRIASYLDNPASQCAAGRDASGRVTLRSRTGPQAGWDKRSLVVRIGPNDILFEGLSISLEVTCTPNVASPVAGSEGRMEVFDADRVGPEVELRFWQAGDRFQPIGMKTDVKLQDFFTNLKVPRDLRHRLVVAAKPNCEIFWVEGLRISEGYKVTPATRRRLVWRWKRA